MKRLAPLLAALVVATGAYAQQQFSLPWGWAGGNGSTGQCLVSNGPILPPSFSGCTAAGSLPAFSGDCTTPGGSAVLTCTKTNGVTFAPSATTDTTNATNITSGQLPAVARLPSIASGTLLGNASGSTAAPSALSALPAVDASSVNVTSNANSVTTAQSLATRAGWVMNAADYGVKCDGSTDDTSALQAFFNAVVASGGRPGVINATGACLFSSTLTISGAFRSIKGMGMYTTTFLYTGASTTNDLIQIEGTSGSSIQGPMEFGGFALRSNTTMTGGAGLHLKWVSQVVLSGLNLSVQNGQTKNLFNGLWIDSSDFTRVEGFQISTLGEGLQVSGVGAGGTGPQYDLFVNGGKINGSTTGVHVGGGWDNAHFDNTEVTVNGTDVVIDNALVPDGTATGGSTTTIVDLARNWPVNAWVGQSVTVTVSSTPYTATVTANTATSMTFAAIGAAVTAGSAYALAGYGSAKNQELVFGPHFVTDQSTTGDDYYINDPFANTTNYCQIVIEGFVTHSYNGNGINIKSWPSCYVNILSPYIVNHHKSGIYVNDTTSYVTVSNATTITNNTRYGIESSGGTGRIASAAYIANNALGLAYSPSGPGSQILGGASKNLTGNFNTSVGYDTLGNVNDQATTANANVAVGYEALENVTTGNNNVAVGEQTGIGSPLTGQKNVLLGFNNGTGITSGSSNVLVGPQVGNNITSGSGNIWLGTSNSCQPSSGTITTGTIGLCAGSTAVYSATGTGTPSTSVSSIAGSLNVAGALTSSVAMANVQTFTSSGTWNAPSSGTPTITCVIAEAAGGGGGGGADVAASTAASGGAGGGGGRKAEACFPTASLGASQTVTIGSGGTGGTGASVSGNAGGNGGQGGNTTFGSLLTAYGGGGGAGGQTGATNSGGGGGAGPLGAGSNSTSSSGGSGGANGGETGGSGTTPSGNLSFNGAPGGSGGANSANGPGSVGSYQDGGDGAAGGGLSTSAAFTGGAGSKNAFISSAALGGANTGGNGSNGSNPTAYGCGTSGGGGGANTSGAGGAAGTSGYCSGGSGGGSAIGTGGNGAVGGSGYLVAITYF